MLADMTADRCYDQVLAPSHPMSKEQSKEQELMEEITKNEKT